MIIQKRICLESKFLNSNIKNHIYNKLQDLTNDCSKEHGYIIKIYPDIKIVDNSVSTATSQTICMVEFKADTLKPEINDILTGKVIMIFKDGIFLKIKDKLKVMIPCAQLSKHSYVFSKKNDIFVKEIEGNLEENKKEDSIKLGDDLTIKVKGVQYDKNNFNCFGDLAK